MEKLKFWLSVNAIFSSSCGLILLGLPSSFFQTFLGFPKDYLLAILLLVFAVFVFWVSRTKKYYRHIVSMIIVMDMVWVLGSIGIFIAQPCCIKALGYWSIGIVAIVVGTLGIQQYRAKP